MLNSIKFKILNGSPLLKYSQTYYFNGAVNTDWNTLGNWWLNSSCTIPATNLPKNLDSVIVVSPATTFMISSPVIIKNLTMNVGTLLSNDSNSTITILGIGNFNGSSKIGWSGVFNGPIGRVNTLSNTVLNFYTNSRCEGIVVGNGNMNFYHYSFSGGGFQSYIIANTISYYDYAVSGGGTANTINFFNFSSASETCDFYGAVNFYNNSLCYGKLHYPGPVTFYDNAIWSGGSSDADVTVIFNNSSCYDNISYYNATPTINGPTIPDPPPPCFAGYQSLSSSKKLVSLPNDFNP